MRMTTGNSVISQRLIVAKMLLLGEATAELKKSKLQYVNVALCDSGLQIPIVSSRLFDVSEDDEYCEFARCCW